MSCSRQNNFQHALLTWIPQRHDRPFREPTISILRTVSHTLCRNPGTFSLLTFSKSKHTDDYMYTSLRHELRAPNYLPTESTERVWEKEFEKIDCLPPFLFSSSNMSLVQSIFHVVRNKLCGTRILFLCMEFRRYLSILVRSCFHQCVLELRGRKSQNLWNSCSTRTSFCCSLRELLEAKLCVSIVVPFCCPIRSIILNMLNPNALPHQNLVLLARNVSTFSSRISRLLFLRGP